MNMLDILNTGAFMIIIQYLMRNGNSLIYLYCSSRKINNKIKSFIQYGIGNYFTVNVVCPHKKKYKYKYYCDGYILCLIDHVSSLYCIVNQIECPINGRYLKCKFTTRYGIISSNNILISYENNIHALIMNIYNQTAESFIYREKHISYATVYTHLGSRINIYNMIHSIYKLISKSIGNRTNSTTYRPAGRFWMRKLLVDVIPIEFKEFIME